mmetsp:Transcript_137860/g.335049  ORF Transcript_137860/g.335049 Transcript_137860/m.335049 type:complete len:160 (+) Transcript_137860:168-647(+)
MSLAAPSVRNPLHDQGTTPAKSLCKSSAGAIRDERLEASLLIQAATRLALQAWPSLQPVVLCMWLVTGAVLSEGTVLRSSGISALPLPLPLRLLLLALMLMLALVLQLSSQAPRVPRSVFGQRASQLRVRLLLPPAQQLPSVRCLCRRVLSKWSSSSYI